MNDDDATNQWWIGGAMMSVAFVIVWGFLLTEALRS